MLLDDLIKTSNLQRSVNITILHSGLPEREVIKDIAETICSALVELGFDANVTSNTIYSEQHITNIILLCHFIYEPDIALLNENMILLNLEQLSSWQFSKDRQKDFYRMLYLFSKCQVWDYSHKNIEFLKQFGFNHIKYLQLGYTPVLACVPYSEQKDIDVLFYGGINERRTKIIDELKDKGINAVFLHGIYGDELDEYIARAKIVLNMHFYDAQIFEIARCYYLMINGVAVVCEVNSSTYVDEIEYLEGIAAVPYERLVDKCCELLENPQALEELRKKAVETIKRFPQTEIMKKFLA